APFDARGIMLMSYRYKDSDKPEAQTKNDDTWVYVPTLRRVRRISSAQRTDAVSGTDFTFDDLLSFSGIIPQYDWDCLGEMDILAPMNTKVKAYPYSKDHNFGPYGLSYADDNWELRKAVKIRFIPTNSDHPYHHKDIYIDKQTLEPLYSFAYDQKEELWKIIWHNHRWSEDDWPAYTGWEGIPEPLENRVVSDTIVNVQTGTGNRIEFWDADGTPLSSKGKIRRYIDIGRLTKGR
ncbi:MAG: outer membrane lipoprotein-sorting protein, partial [Myxococcota bacterium]